MKNIVAMMVVLGLVLILCMAGFAADIKSGEAVYAKNNCKLCHSIAGVGNKKTPLDGVGAKLTAEQMNKWVRTPKDMNAKTTMLAYPVAKISDADLADLTAYLLSLKK